MAGQQLSAAEIQRQLELLQAQNAALAALAMKPAAPGLPFLLSQSTAPITRGPNPQLLRAFPALLCRAHAPSISVLVLEDAAFSTTPTVSGPIVSCLFAFFPRNSKNFSTSLASLAAPPLHFLFPRMLSFCG